MSTQAVDSTGIRVELPVRGNCKAQCDALKVKWLGSFEGNPFLVEAALPLDWGVRAQPSSDWDKKIFTILDPQGMPQAEVWLKTASHHQAARIRLFSEEERLEMSPNLASKSLQEQFNSLLTHYNCTIRSTYGTGASGQKQIDKAYTPLAAFVRSHLAFSSELPKKHVCYNLQDEDGAIGGCMAMPLNLMIGKN